MNVGKRAGVVQRTCCLGKQPNASDGQTNDKGDISTVTRTGHFVVTQTSKTKSEPLTRAASQPLSTMMAALRDLSQAEEAEAKK